MLNKTIWVIITVIIALVMLFGNRKAKVTQILAAQLRVFRNAKTRKTSIWDSICFEGHRHRVGAFIFCLQSASPSAILIMYR